MSKSTIYRAAQKFITFIFLTLTYRNVHAIILLKFQVSSTKSIKYKNTCFAISFMQYSRYIYSRKQN